MYRASAVKLGIFDFATGLYGFHYEHELSSIFSIQAGGGLTGRNYAQGLIHSDDDINSQPSSNNLPESERIPDNYYKYAGRTSKLGYFVVAQPKFYFEEDGFDGPYFGFCFQYRRYNFTAANVDPSSTSNAFVFVNENSFAEFENQTIVALAYGKQDTNQKTILDWSCSIGLRNLNGERRDVWLYVDPNTGNSTATAYTNKVSMSQLYFDVSLKIGLFWTNKKS